MREPEWMAREEGRGLVLKGRGGRGGVENIESEMGGGGLRDARKTKA